MSNAILIPCSNAEYHARPEWSHSQVEDLVTSPALFYGRHVAKPALFPRETSAALDLGTLVHAALLEPERLADLCAIIPREALSKKGRRQGKAWDAFEEASEGKILLKQEEFMPVSLMVANCKAEPNAAKLLAMPGPVEHSLIWTDLATGLPLRCRIDKLGHGKTAVVVTDIKTSRAGSERDFVRDAVRYGYFRQAAWYWDGAEEAGHDVAGFAFVVIDKTPAHECRVYTPCVDDIEVARRQNRSLLEDLARRLEANDWHGRDFGRVRDIGLPKWARKENPWEIENEHSTDDNE